MLYGCGKVEELNLSSFDTRNAKAGVVTSTNGTASEAVLDMFTGMTSLRKITLGENFRFTVDGTTAFLPTPSADFIAGAEGYWFTEDGSAYTPEELPNVHSGVVTYYAVTPVPLMVIESGKLRELASAVRAKTGLTGGMTLDELVLALLEGTEV